MSREPSSAMHRYNEAIGRSGAVDLPTPLAPNPEPKKPRNFSIRVEPKKKPRKQAISKMLKTTEQLSPEERRIVRGYRLSVGGPAAEQERIQIEREVRRP